MAIGDGDILSGMLDRFRELIREGLADGSLKIGQTLDIKALMLSKGIEVSDVDEAKVVANLIGYVSSVAGGKYPHKFKYEQSQISRNLKIVAIQDEPK